MNNEIDDWNMKEKKCEICCILPVIKKNFCNIPMNCIRISFIGLVIVGYHFVIDIEFILYFLDVYIYKDMGML